MSHPVPITEYAPAERVPIDIVQRQSAAVSPPLQTFDWLGAARDYLLIVNAQRQVVFASRNVRDLLPPESPLDPLGMRLGEALQCRHHQRNPGGCGTSIYCSECGAVNVMLANLEGRPEIRECRILRLAGDHLEAMDLRVSGLPMELAGDRYSLIWVSDVGHEKRRRAMERIFFHDVINTTGGLVGLAEPLAQNAPPDLKEDLSLLREGLEELLEEVQSQKDLAAAESGELTTRLSSLDSLAVLKQVLHLYRNHPVSRRRTLRLAPESVAITFASDVVLLRRILGNLVKNALEAVPPEGTVSAGCEAAGPGVRFWVHNPTLMPPASQRQIFNRSFSTKGADRGLGTYSVRLLAERYLRGRVSFTSTAEEGTTFRVELPNLV